MKRVIAVLGIVLLMITTLMVPAEARVTISEPSGDAIEDARKELSIPQNLRVKSIASDSITIVWKYENGYEVTYTTDPSAEPQWKNQVTVPKDTSITEVEYKIDNLSPNTTYYIYVRHAKIEVINMYMTFVGGDPAKVQATTSQKTPANTEQETETSKTGSGTSPTQTSTPQVATLVAKAKTFKAGVKNKKYVVTLKSGKTPIKNAKLTLKVNGKTYKATTNSSGKVTFNITKLKKKGTFTAVIKFAGNKNYKATSKNVKIKVKK